MSYPVDAEFRLDLLPCVKTLRTVVDHTSLDAAAINSTLPVAGLSALGAILRSMAPYRSWGDSRPHISRCEDGTRRPYGGAHIPCFERGARRISGLSRVDAAVCDQFIEVLLASYE